MCNFLFSMFLKLFWLLAFHHLVWFDVFISCGINLFGLSVIAFGINLIFQWDQLNWDCCIEPPYSIWCVNNEWYCTCNHLRYSTIRCAHAHHTKRWRRLCANISRFCFLSSFWFFFRCYGFHLCRPKKLNKYRPNGARGKSDKRGKLKNNTHRETYTYIRNYRSQEIETKRNQICAG